MPSVVSAETWEALLERDEYQCLQCNADEGLQPAHYIARSLLGDDSLENLVLLCGECHRAHHNHKLVIKRIGDHFFFKDLRRWRNFTSQGE